MLKQSFNRINRIKKGFAILLVVLFVVSFTGVAANAERGHSSGHEHYGHGHYGGYGWTGYGDWGGYGGYSGCGWVNGVWVCPAYGYPYI